VTAAIVVGVVAGLASGQQGIGGGAIIVPGLVLFVGLSQVDAEATSLLAIVPTALVGAWRQSHYGNVRWRDGVALGVLAAGGAAAGSVLANILPERTLQLAFAGLLIAIAAHLAYGALRGSDRP
jgi:uncharacterized membrane protein YfcA